MSQILMWCTVSGMVLENKTLVFCCDDIECISAVLLHSRKSSCFICTSLSFSRAALLKLVLIMLQSPAALDLFLLGSDTSLINGFSVSSVSEAKVCNIKISSYFGGLYNKTIFAKGICAIGSPVLS